VEWLDRFAAACRVPDRRPGIPHADGCGAASLARAKVRAEPKEHFSLQANDFEIGTYFTNGWALWLCTDVGSRIIAGIRVDRVETATLRDGVRTNGSVDARRDPSWLSGPPYKIAEMVFDEDDLVELRLIAAGEVSAWVPDVVG
jgi:hypothetical protein